MKEQEDSLWVGRPVTLTRALSQVMPDSGSLQMPIWSQRLLALISSPHVHIKGKSTEGFLIPRIAFFLHRFLSEKYLRRLQEVQNWWRKTASNFTVKGLWSWDDNSFRIFSEHENCLLTDCQMRRLLRNLGFREHRPEDFWIYLFFWSCHKIYSWKGIVGRLKISSSYEWMSWFWFASKSWRRRRRRFHPPTVPSSSAKP